MSVNFCPILAKFEFVLKILEKNTDFERLLSSGSPAGFFRADAQT